MLKNKNKIICMKLNGSVNIAALIIPLSMKNLSQLIVKVTYLSLKVLVCKEKNENIWELVL